MFATSFYILPPPHPESKNSLIFLTKQKCIPVGCIPSAAVAVSGVCTISLRFRFRYFSQIQIWTPMLMDTGNLIIAGVQPSNAVSNPVMQPISRLSVIVFILVFNAGHRQFTCCRCPNLNLREISESESDALRIHVLGEGVSA